MKKVLLMGVLASFMLASCGTAKSPEMKRLENQQQALKLNSELNELQMKLTQEQTNNQSLQTEATQANEEATNRTDALVMPTRLRQVLKKRTKLKRLCARLVRLIRN
ncbi:Uncharacterised protein [Capnocytophaga ochracea]|uniref:Lipoprotein n=1 Tax=Capnocytophaga ochracea TaxID=1018 RepID=A0A2X1H2I1_CAPOC|nr:Uncharacterised protein [Capnocytophaga ochracea]